MSKELKYCYKSGVMECGTDESGMGTLFGPVFAGCVFWDPEIKHPLIQDSKKLTRRQKLIAYDFIREEALGYGIAKVEPEEVDIINIKKAGVKAMHKAIDNSFISPDHIIVDGNYFRFYLDKNGEQVSHTCVVEGDGKYTSVAAASILAKVSHDMEIQKLCDEYPDLEKYGLRSNVGYAAKVHCDAIEEYGVTQFHRKTFGKVKEWNHKPNILKSIHS